jgi:hypothetical protein
MEDFLPAQTSAVALPTADVRATVPSGAKVEYEAYPVRRPEADLNDFKVQVRASNLARCRATLTRAAKTRFPWHEMALGTSTLSTGAFLGALPATIAAGTAQSVFFYTMLPIVGVSTFVCYLFLRRTMIQEPAELAAAVLAELPDPDRAR